MFDDKPVSRVGWDGVNSGATNDDVQSSTNGAGSDPLPTGPTVTSPEPVQEERITPAMIIADTDQLIKQSVMEQPEIGISAEDLLLRPIENIPCLIEPLLQKTGIACIAGSSDTGKSSFLRYLCMCVVSGKSDFLGFKIKAEYRRAIYVSTEDDEIAVNYLLNKQNTDLQVKPSELRGLRFLFDTEKLPSKLDSMLTQQPADIVCIDAFTDLYNQSMNESNQVRGFLNKYSLLAGKHKCLILFLHHCGKRTEELTPSKNHLLGSQAFEAKMRLVIELRTDTVDCNLKHLCIVKGNYLPNGAKNESYQLRFTDNMTFVNTGERVPFDVLAKVNEYERVTREKQERDDQRYQRIKELKSAGLTHSAIAEEIGYKNKCSVSKLIKKHEERNSVSLTFPKETKETELRNVKGKLPF
jgi:hypothetical protein